MINASCFLPLDISDELFFHIRMLELETLFLNECDITDNGLRDLADIRTLKELNLRDCISITDSGVAHLTQLSNTLTELNLWNCRGISDTSCSHLNKLVKLKRLTLRECSISTTGLLELSRMPQGGCSSHKLEVLDVRDCDKITPNDASKFFPHTHVVGAKVHVHL
jgi:hypothetical protein